MRIEDLEDLHELSPMQQGILFHMRSAGEPGAYFSQFVGTIENLDPVAFARAWQTVAERHAILRASFHWEEMDKPLAVVHRGITVPVETEDWRGLSAIDQKARLEAFLREDASRGLDLSRAPQLRITLIRTGEESHDFVWSFPHLVMDRWSLALVLKEVLEICEGRLGTASFRSADPRPFRDYIAWLQRQSLFETETFWRQDLRGFKTPTALDLPAPSTVARSSYGRETLRLSEGASSRLRAIARNERLTLSTLVQGAWALLLSRYSGQEDIVYGVTVSGRPPELPGVDSMVGLFINTLPMRSRMSAAEPLLPWMRKLQDDLLERRQHEYSPLVEVQGWSEVKRGLPLFETVFVFENIPLQEPLGHDGIKIGNPRIFGATNYPLTAVAEPGRELSLRCHYQTSRFEAATVLRMLRHWSTLLEGIAEDPHRRLAEIPLLTQAERQEITIKWNQTRSEYPREKCLHELFEEWAERTPGAVAAESSEERLTYGELNRRANRLALLLEAEGVGPEVLVAVCVESSLEMVVGILGILKAGGAYVPLDPAYPKERLAFMLSDTRAPLLLTERHLEKSLPAGKARVVCLDGDWGSRQSDQKRINRVTPENLAYVIYTSGSTGKPKGVAIAHQGAVNLVLWHRRAYAVTPLDRGTQLAGPAFDASVWEIWPYLTAGASVQFPGEEISRSPSALWEWLASRGITLCYLPTPLAEEALEEPPPPLKLSLRALLTGGDRLRRAPRRTLSFPLVNHYGPTENSVVTTCGSVRSDTGAPPSIGRPIANTKVYVLDRYGDPAPSGIPGELHIAGVGLARGYWNRPDLTAEKFLPNPFGQAGERLYRTGDRVRYAAEGNLEFLGRLDEQVKVRGFRVELGEVEAVLSAHPSVKECVVALRGEDGPAERRLVAYVAWAGESREPSELKRFLKERLPEQMVPSAFVVLERLPRASSGKIDRRALPAPEPGSTEPSVAYLAPRDGLERQLVEIWQQVLNVRRIGVQDDFFELGGHSLLATRVVSRLRLAAGIDVSLRDLFESPTVAKLARAIGRRGRVEDPSAVER